MGCSRIVSKWFPIIGHLMSLIGEIWLAISLVQLHSKFQKGKGFTEELMDEIAHERDHTIGALVLISTGAALQISSHFMCHSHAKW
jgi:hypothetical protein